MLHNINDQGTIAWHCHTPTCSYHNCSQWDPEVRCGYHGELQRQQPVGKTHTAHIISPDIIHQDELHIRLPQCQECGSVMTLRVHDEEETTPPIVTRDEQTGKILQVAPHPHWKFSGNLWIVDADTVKRKVPHPTLAHLQPHEIDQIVTSIKAKAPDTPLDWMQQELTTTDIKRVYQHPAVERHRELSRQLKAIGKHPGHDAADADVPLQG